MRALSIHAPWTWAILHAGKDIENRLWTVPPSPGPMLLHASKECRRKAYLDAAENIRLRSACVLPPVEELKRGGLVGLAVVREVVTGHPSKWAIPGYHHLVLVDVVPLPFVPWTGQQKFFQVTAAELGKHAGAYVEAWEAALAAERRAA